MQKLIILLCLILASCTEQDTNKNIQNPQSEDTARALIKAEISSDTLIVNRKVAVFYQPDSTKIKKRKKEIGERNFFIGADDYMYSMHMADEFLESVKLEMFDAKDKKFLKFIGAGGTYQTVKLDTLSELWGIYFFDPLKKPRLVDITMIEEEYKSYFK